MGKHWSFKEIQSIILSAHGQRYLQIKILYKKNHIHRDECILNKSRAAELTEMDSAYWWRSRGVDCSLHRESK